MIAKDLITIRKNMKKIFLLNYKISITKNKKNYKWILCTFIAWVFFNLLFIFFDKKIVYSDLFKYLGLIAHFTLWINLSIVFHRQQDLEKYFKNIEALDSIPSDIIYEEEVLSSPKKEEPKTYVH